MAITILYPTKSYILSVFPGMANALEQLEELVTCSVCLDTFRDPRVLSCQHTFCLKCLQNIHRKQPKGTAVEGLRCPLDRQVSPLPLQGGVEDFPRNLTMVQNIEIIKVKQMSQGRFAPARRMSMSRPGLSVVCNACVGTTDLSVCDHCKQTLCARLVDYTNIFFPIMPIIERQKSDIQ